MTKDIRIKIYSFVLASVLSALCTFNSLTIISYASSSDWEALGDDVVALKDAYVNYIKSCGSGDIGEIIGSAVDIPTSWVKTLVDGTKAISPVDDWFYYLTDEDKSGGGPGHVRSGGSSSHTSDRPADEVSPVLPSSYFKEASSYYNEHFKPHSNSSQYIWSYQTCNSTSSSPYSLPAPDLPVYMHAFGSWGKKNWSEVYLLPFLSDDYYSFYHFYTISYFHIYSTGSGASVLLHVDKISLSDSSDVETYYEAAWDIEKYPFLGIFYNTNSDLVLSFFTSYDNYLSDNSYQVRINKLFPKARPQDNSSSDVFFGDLRRSSSFTPSTNSNDDWGFYVSSQPFYLYSQQNLIDYNKIPDNYYITVKGDNIFDYDITNPDTGDTIPVIQYITNNYNIPSSGGTDESSEAGDGGNTTNNTWNIDFPDFITNITTSIETAITNVFVADETVINQYNQEIQDAFNDKLPFVSDFKEIFQSFFVEIVDNNFVYAADINKPDEGGTESGNSVKPENIIYPKWEVNINYFGNDMTLTILDFSMYAEPLYYVRLVVCIFVYVIYFVNLMKYLPTLIGNVVDMTGRVTSYVSNPKSGGND